jgi:hypothetical protein
MSDEYVRDCRGRIIYVGSTVVVAEPIGGRLQEQVVRALERRRNGSWWVLVRFRDGGWSTPDRCAVVR